MKSKDDLPQVEEKTVVQLDDSRPLEIQITVPKNKAEGTRQLILSYYDSEGNFITNQLTIIATPVSV